MTHNIWTLNSFYLFMSKKMQKPNLYVCLFVFFFFLEGVMAYMMIK